MRAVSTLLWIVLLAANAQAADGVLEINQACATGPGCFPADAPGLPVQIIGSGSYRLTSDLTAPDGNTTLVSIQSSQVSLDLNGFAIKGPNTFGGPGGTCTAPGTGIGVTATTGARYIAVSNGHVRGMGSHGISLGNVIYLRIDRIVAEQNCGLGIGGGTLSLMTNSVARRNAGRGFTATSSSQIRNSVADFNQGSGIDPLLGTWLVQGCVANGNGVHGIVLPSNNGNLVTDSLATNNAQHGFLVGANSLVLRSSAVANLQSGIFANGNTTGLGFMTTNGNGVDVSGGPALVACLVAGGGQFCP